MAPPVDHDLGAVPVIPTPVVVPIPVSLAYIYPNAAEPDIGALRDDHRFVDNDRGTGKCRHGEEWNNTECKSSFPHGTLLSLGRSTSPTTPGSRMVLSSLKKLAALVTKRPRYGRLIARAYIRAALPSFVDDGRRI
jgi:hypothetical protein